MLEIVTTIIAVVLLFVTLVVNRKNLADYFNEVVEFPPQTRGKLYLIGFVWGFVFASIGLMLYSWRLGVLLERMR